MNKVLYAFLIVAVFTVFSSCKSGYDTYSDSLNGFEINIPKGWVFLTPSSENVAAAFQREHSDSEDPTGVVISAGELPQGFTVKEFADKIESIFPTILKGYVKKETSDIKSGKLVGRLAVYECIMYDKKVVKQQAFFTGNNFGYSVIVTFVLNDYSDKEKEIARTVIESFNITGTVKK
jgi:hypothetical protein